jgi:pimeloyl-ACP methyl ester carboxylesterase
MNNLGYVFIPGGGMSSWVWKDLDGEMKSNALLISGRLKTNTYHNRLHASLASCVDYIEEQIAQKEYARVVIVAHSGGGILAPLLARRTKAKVDRIIFISANIPAQHASALQALPFPIRLLNVFAAKMQIKNEYTSMQKYGKFIREKFCNSASDEVIAYVMSQNLLAEPLCVFNEKVDWSGVSRIPMTYIRLLNDKTASLKLQDRMAANLNISDKYDIDSDHMVMLSHPRQFNEALCSIVKKTQYTPPGHQSGGY